MKFKGFPLYLVVFLALSHNCTAGTIFGGWEWRYNPANAETPATDFTLALKPRGDGRVEGSYCSITHAGMKIDCGGPGENNLHGIADKRSFGATVHFRSFFGASGGVARVKLVGDNLEWVVTRAPAGGEFHGPMQATLSRTRAEQKQN